jgi:hypothetical protein
MQRRLFRARPVADGSSGQVVGDDDDDDSKLRRSTLGGQDREVGRVDATTTQ